LGKSFVFILLNLHTKLQSSTWALHFLLIDRGTASWDRTTRNSINHFTLSLSIKDGLLQ
jgi:hypothetical protein